jgi:hypothetical protein
MWGVTIENLRLNGRPITSAGDAHPQIGKYVQDVRFVESGSKPYQVRVIVERYSVSVGRSKYNLRLLVWSVRVVREHGISRQTREPAYQAAVAIWKVGAVEAQGEILRLLRQPGS